MILYTYDDGRVITKEDLDKMSTEEKLDLLHEMNIIFAKQVDDIIKESKTK